MNGFFWAPIEISVLMATKNAPRVSARDQVTDSRLQPFRIQIGNALPTNNFRESRQTTIAKVVVGIVSHSHLNQTKGTRCPLCARFHRVSPSHVVTWGGSWRAQGTSSLGRDHLAFRSIPRYGKHVTPATSPFLLCTPGAVGMCPCEI